MAHDPLEVTNYAWPPSQCLTNALRDKDRSDKSPQYTMICKRTLENVLEPLKCRKYDKFDMSPGLTVDVNAYATATWAVLTHEKVTRTNIHSLMTPAQNLCSRSWSGKSHWETSEVSKSAWIPAKWLKKKNLEKKNYIIHMHSDDQRRRWIVNDTERAVKIFLGDHLQSQKWRSKESKWMNFWW